MWLVGLPILYPALVFLSPSEMSRFYYVYLWMRFAIIGLWISYLVPKLVASLKKNHENSDAPAAR